ncbi:hypothetical protein J502_2241 [Acinetobacter sp. 1294596]|uniref:hypothetical protein n=1 Tax=Acinetobacter TaxID=469 RepID=UPI00044E04FF|nr:hypothetical protein [Acinetobacter sp. 1294596]EXF56672.1 hypothetical protein J502_2241 [Acinetobacter sp. 1294596]
MKTRTKGIIAAVGFIFSIGIYYYLSLAIEWMWSDVCAKHYCMKTPTLAEFLAIEVAVIGLYFVISSLDEWKKQYKFTKEIETMEEFTRAKQILELLVSKIHYLITECRRYDYMGMYEAEKEFKEILKIQNVHNRIYNLRNTIFEVANNLHQKDIENLFYEFNTIVDNIIACVNENHLSEANNTEDKEYNFNQRKKKVDNIEVGLKKLRESKKVFENKFNKVKNKTKT